MKVLVLGGTGTVGSQVARELLNKNNVEVFVLSRSEEKLNGMQNGLKGIVGDLMSVDTERSVFKGMDAVFLLNALSETETHQALMAVNSAKEAGVKRIVYMTVHLLEQAPHLPHFGSKIPVEMALKASGLQYTILRPNNFYQNDYWFKDVILQHGIYPQPIGDLGMSRVDVRDIAEAAALALTEEGHDGKVYNLVGPDALTGQSTAEAWSKALGRTIIYGGNDLDQWEKAALSMLPPWLAFDFKLMYAFFQKKGFKGTTDDVYQVTSLLGHAPRSFEAFVQETVKQWV